MNFMVAIDVVILGFGLYFLFLTIKMNKTQTIPKELLVEEEKKKIKDVPGFIKYLFVPMMISAVSFIILGACCLLLDLEVVKIPNANYVLLAIFLLVFGFYVARFRNAKLKYI